MQQYQQEQHETGDGEIGLQMNCKDAGSVEYDPYGNVKQRVVVQERFNQN